MADKSLYELVLGKVAEGVAPVELKPPRVSAAVVLWRRRQDGKIEVFWMRRAETLAFMGGWHAFPGGGLSRRDALIPVRGEPRGANDGPDDAGMPAAVVGPIELGPAVSPEIVACALRELFEETGLLLTGAASEDRAADLEAHIAGGEKFGPAILDMGLELDATELRFAGRWLTPPLGPMRFDNRFFLLEWPDDGRREPRSASTESAEVEWVDPAAALSRWESGEIIAAPPILHLLRVLAEDGPQDPKGRLLNPVECNLGPHRRVEFQPGVVLFPLPTPTLPPAAYTNCYLLGFEEAVLVDPGSPNTDAIGGLLEALAAAAEQGRRVRAIWLTHHHPDHVGGVEAVRRALGVPVLAHRATAERLAVRGIEVDDFLEDGQRVVLKGQPSMTLRVLHTPGHARGHLCFLDEVTGALIAGDIIAGIGTIVIDPPEGDMDQYLDSLDRLVKLEPRTLFPAHGPTVRTAVAKLREYVEHRLWREERVLEAWRSGTRESSALVAKVYDDVPEIAHPLAARQLEAHLDRLRRLGALGQS